MDTVLGTYLYEVLWLQLQCKHQNLNLKRFLLLLQPPLSTGTTLCAAYTPDRAITTRMMLRNKQ